MARRKLPASSSNKGPSKKTQKRGPSSSSAKKRRSPTRSRGKGSSLAVPLLVGVALGLLVAFLVVGGLLVLKGRRTGSHAPGPSRWGPAGFKELRSNDELARGVERLVTNGVKAFAGGGLSKVDSASYRSCSQRGCWRVHTATYLVVEGGGAPSVLARLEKGFYSMQRPAGVEMTVQHFQWLKGNGILVSFSHRGMLVGRYTFVAVPGEGVGSAVLKFKPFVSQEGETPLARENKPMVAIVIDDLGYTRQAADLFLNLPFPVTVSVIPFTPFVGYTVKVARARGKEVMLHIPMESGGHREAIERMESRTKGMLRVSMSDAEIRALVRREIDAVPGAIGANNHMGSRFTRNRHKMGVVLGELKRQGLFFLDSLTSSRSVGYKTALTMGIPALKRDVFLDHSRNKRAMDHQFKRLAAIALKRGYAVAIGHPFLPTYRMIREGASKLRAMGIQIVPISRLLRRVEGAKHGRSGFQKAGKP